jgi:uncharacterized protein
MPRVMHFEIPADDMDRAEKFYAAVFGWTFRRWEGPMDYRLATTGGSSERGIDGALLKRPHPGAGTVNTVDVPSLDEYVWRVEKAGGRVTVPRMAIPGVGWLAYVADPEGNQLGLMQPDPAAA